MVRPCSKLQQRSLPKLFGSAACFSSKQLKQVGEMRGVERKCLN
jgi:hypothetical protein